MTLDPTVITDNWLLFARGLGLTVQISAVAIVIGALIAVAFTAAALSPWRVLRWLMAVISLLLRGIPFIVLVFLIHFGLPSMGMRLPPLLSGTVALSLFAAAYFAEMLLGVLASLPKGQWESGRVVGFSAFQILRYIIVPQILRPSVPPAVNIAIMVVKESSVISAITVGELTYQGLVVQGNTFAPFEVFFAVAILYWATTFALSQLGGWAERELLRSHGGDARPGGIAQKYLSLERVK